MFNIIICVVAVLSLIWMIFKGIRDIGIKGSFWLIVVLFTISAAAQSFRSEAAQSICFAVLFLLSLVAVEEISKRERKLQEEIERLEASNNYYKERVRELEESK